MSSAKFIALANCARAVQMRPDAFVAFLTTCPGVAIEVRFGRRGLFDFDLAAALGEIAERQAASAAHLRTEGA